MDSGSSGSIQSSDEDYDSRSKQRSGLLNSPPLHVGPIPNPPQPHSSSTMFDPFSNFFDPPLNLDPLWPPRNPPFTGLISPSSSSTQTQPSVTSQLQAPNQVPQTNAPLTEVANNGNIGVRNPRKRTRASRRAPTTVLTTDTSNFRAMVQEFTGIPAPPFTPASSFPRSRLDFFGGTSTSSPSYLLRPFPQKLSSFSPPTTSSSDFLLQRQNLPRVDSILNLQPPPLQPAHINSDHVQVTVENVQSGHRNPHLQTGVIEDFSLRQSQAHLSGNVSVRKSSSNVILPTRWDGRGAASDQALRRSLHGKYCNDND